ncbi:hypothetical protein Barb4_02391 [Bacteroidales bacterium Barb4]|nr:hypothetical protein Barb4_02391 [Bacteroidales bacterium Barb4]
MTVFIFLPAPAITQTIIILNTFRQIIGCQWIVFRVYIKPSRATISKFTWCQWIVFRVYIKQDIKKISPLHPQTPKRIHISHVRQRFLYACILLFSKTTDNHQGIHFSV